MESRKFFWVILAMCILSAAATLLQLTAVYFMSLPGVPDVNENFLLALSKATDVGKIKAACSSLAQWHDSERMGRVKLMIFAPLIALLTSTVCGICAARALLKIRGTVPR